MQKLYLTLKDKKITYIVLISFSIGVFTYAYYCGFQKVCKSEIAEKIVRPGKELVLPKGTVFAEVVNTPASRAKGLSRRSTLPEDEGMLFIFEHPGKYGFWMKDMHFPIDMVWISSDGVVVHVERHVDPSSYNEENPRIFVNEPDALYVLELKDGYAEKYGLFLGTKVKLGE